MYLSMIDLQGETEASSLSGINDNPTLCMQSYIYIYIFVDSKHGYCPAASFQNGANMDLKFAFQ